jgi:Arc/MetJ-type ribon-helix-helix transcriptional regulator
LSEKISIDIPKKLADFIDKLTEQGYFNSRDDFARCSLEIIAQLYGLSKTAAKGKSLLDVLIDNGKASTVSKPLAATTKASAPKQITKKTDALTPDEYDILDLFSGAKFEFEDALHARYTMELMKMAKAPLPKEEFLKLLQGLADKKKIERTEHNEKIVWKVIDKY